MKPIPSRLVRNAWESSAVMVTAWESSAAAPSCCATDSRRAPSACGSRWNSYGRHRLLKIGPPDSVSSRAALVLTPPMSQPRYADVPLIQGP